MSRENLNECEIWIDSYIGERKTPKLLDYSMQASDVEIVDVVFKNLKYRLIAEIEKYDAVFGCVAWVTDFDIINALNKIDSVIVLQKEDFLRPDTGGTVHEALRHAYSFAKNKIGQYEMPGLCRELSVCWGRDVERYRCVGNHNADKKQASPRSHHKFVVFCKKNKVKPIDRLNDEIEKITPVSVWTGSFNFTNNGSRSFENAVIIHDKKIAQAYLDEFSQVYALSEELSWESPWVEPQYRIGT